MMPGKSLAATIISRCRIRSSTPRTSGQGRRQRELEMFDFPGEYAQRFNKPDERLGEVEKLRATAKSEWKRKKPRHYLQIDGVQHAGHRDGFQPTLNCQGRPMHQ